LEHGSNQIAENQLQLLRACREGKEPAFRELYLLYNKAMYNICVRMLNDQDEAKDVLQESFISAFRNIRQFNGKASFGSWLRRIVINKCIDSIKRRNPNMVSLSDNSAVTEENENENSEEEYNIEDIRSCMMRLPDGYRIILTLFLFENYSHRMIAEEMGISEGTSKSQYSRARKKLAGLMKMKSHD
jgi:RNA polymerase sigma factor (sigma-70 family)